MIDTGKLRQFMIVLLMMTLIIKTGCSRDTAPYEIGIVLPLSGAGRTRSMDVMKGVEIGFEEINTIKGVRGKELRAVYIDAEQDEVVLKERLAQMISQQRMVLFIVLEKRASALLCSLDREENTVIFADHDELYEFSEHPLYAVTPRPFNEAKLAGSLTLKQLKSRRAFLIIADEDARAARFAEGFKQGYGKEGGGILNTLQYEAGQETSEQLHLIKSFNVDLAVIAAYDNPSLPIQALRNAGFEGSIIIPSASARIMEAAGFPHSSDTIFYAVPAFSPNAKINIVQDFQERYRRKFNQDANYTASIYYDLAEIIAYVLEINGDDTKRIHPFLGKLRDYNAITGRTSYYPDGEVEKPMRLEQVR